MVMKISIDKSTAIKAVCQMLGIEVIFTKRMDKRKLDYMPSNAEVEFDFECQPDTGFCNKKMNVYWFNRLMRLIAQMDDLNWLPYADFIELDVIRKYHEWENKTGEFKFKSQYESDRAKVLKEKTNEHLNNIEFHECPTCAEKPGSPILCNACLENRRSIEKLKLMMRDDRE